MPSHYAHYRLGRQVRLELTPDSAEVVGRWPSLYLIGLHGPDILFYYRGYRENPVNRLGYALHGETGEAFVRWAMQVIAAHPGQDAHRAYAYGVLCHFALDESCHGIVARQMAAHGVSHVGLEAEFDRYLTQKYGDWRGELPPEEQRGHHEAVLCDLNRPCVPYGQAVPGKGK